MQALDYIRFAVLILLVMPAVVLPWEGRRAPDLLYLAIALAGAVFAFVRSGADGALVAVAGGLACLFLILSLVAALRFATGRQILTGGQIKLLSSGAICLGVLGSLFMILFMGVVLFILGALHTISGSARRPDSNAIVAAAILCTGFGQIMMLAR